MPKAQDYRQWLIDAEVPFPSNTAIEALCELIVQHQPAGQHADEGAQPLRQKQRKKKGQGKLQRQQQQQQRQDKA